LLSCAVQEKTAVAEVKRRVRMSKDELEAELFKRFAEQPHWHFVQLQVSRKQRASVCIFLHIFTRTWWSFPTNGLL
jgi:hypothetical protein